MYSVYKRYVYRLCTSPFFWGLGGILVVVSFLNSLFWAGGFFGFFPLLSILLIPALASIPSPAAQAGLLPLDDLKASLAEVCALLTAAVFFLLLTIPLPLVLPGSRPLEGAAVGAGYAVLVLYLASACALCVFFSSLLRHRGAAFAVSALVLAFFSLAHVAASAAGTPRFISSFLAALSFSWHADAASKGIVDSRDVVFYLASFLFFSAAAAAAIQRRRGNGGWNFRRLVALVAAAYVLVLLNASAYYGRLDLTRKKTFSVSPFSSVLLSEADAPLSISYYRSRSLRRLLPQIRDIEDYIKAYAAAGKKVSYEILDPADRKGLEEQLELSGITGQDLELGQAAAPLHRVFSAIAINYRGQTEVIPFVLGMDSLEYDMSFRVQKLVRDRRPRLYAVVGNGLSLEKDYAYLSSWLSFQGFDLRAAPSSYLSQGLFDPSAEDSCLLLLGSSALSSSDVAALAAYLDGGGRACIATTPYTVALDDGWTVGLQERLPFDRLAVQLMKYGIYFKETLTASSDCFVMSLREGTASAHVEQLSYPLWPSLPPQESAPEGLLLFWPCAMDLDADVADEAGVSLEGLLWTSGRSWQYGSFETNPFAVSASASPGEERGRFCLAVCASRAGRPAFCVLGDQYAPASQMMAFASSPSGVMDTRGLSFLSDALLRLEGEGELLKLKNKGKADAGRDVRALAGGSLAEAVCLCLVLPLLALLACCTAVSIARKKRARRLKLILGKSS